MERSLCWEKREREGRKEDETCFFFGFFFHLGSGSERRVSLCCTLYRLDSAPGQATRWKRRRSGGNAARLLREPESSRHCGSISEKASNSSC